MPLHTICSEKNETEHYILRIYKIRRILTSNCKGQQKRNINIRISDVDKYVYCALFCLFLFVGGVRRACMNAGAWAYAIN